jgi:hypothetical protein
MDTGIFGHDIKARGRKWPLYRGADWEGKGVAACVQTKLD